LLAQNEKQNAFGLRNNWIGFVFIVFFTAEIAKSAEKYVIFAGAKGERPKE